MFYIYNFVLQNSIFTKCWKYYFCIFYFSYAYNNISLIGVVVFKFTNLNCQNLNCRNLSCRNLSCRNLNCQNLNCQNLNCQNLNCQNLNCQNLNCQNLNCRAPMVSFLCVYSSLRLVSFGHSIRKSISMVMHDCLFAALQFCYVLFVSCIHVYFFYYRIT